MAERGEDLVIVAQILVDRPALRGRFDDDDIHSWRSTSGSLALDEGQFRSGTVMQYKKVARVDPTGNWHRPKGRR